MNKNSLSAENLIREVEPGSTKVFLNTFLKFLHKKVDKKRSF
jgi:hypothetical protein